MEAASTKQSVVNSNLHQKKMEFNIRHSTQVYCPSPSLLPPFPSPLTHTHSSKQIFTVQKGKSVFLIGGVYLILVGHTGMT